MSEWALLRAIIHGDERRRADGILRNATSLIRWDTIPANTVHSWHEIVRNDSFLFYIFNYFTRRLQTFSGINRKLANLSRKINATTICRTHTHTNKHTNTLLRSILQIWKKYYENCFTILGFLHCAGSPRWIKETAAKWLGFTAWVVWYQPSSGQEPQEEEEQEASLNCSTSEFIFVSPIKPVLMDKLYVGETGHSELRITSLQLCSKI